MPNTFNLRFEDLFKISTMCLRLNRSHTAIPRDVTWKLQFFVIIASSFFGFFISCFSVVTHDIKTGDFSAASRNISMIIVFINVNLKYMLLVIHQETIQDFIKFVDKDYNEDYCDVDQNIVLNYAEKGVNVCRFWLAAGFAAMITFPAKAFVSMGYYYWKEEFKLVAMFEMTYPEPIESNKNIPVIFCLLFALTFVFDVYASTMYIGSDPLVPIWLLHICGQISILSRRVNIVFAKYKDPKEIEEQLKIIIVKQQELCKFVNSIKSCFTILYECNLKTSTFLLPLAAFQIIEDLRDHWINVEFVAMFCASVIHFLIPSYYSDLLMEKSEEFRQAIYSSGWQEYPDKRVRQIILFMLTKTRIPMGIRTVFLDINLDTFTNMCQQAYAILNLMNASFK